MSDQLELARARGAAPGSNTLITPTAVPHPRSVEGAFHVANDVCLACDFPHQIAPDLIGYVSESSDTYHCFFKCQPKTAGEVELAVEALAASCCGGLRYRGTDLNVIAAIIEQWEAAASVIDLLTTKDSQNTDRSNGGGR